MPRDEQKFLKVQIGAEYSEDGDDEEEIPAKPTPASKAKSAPPAKSVPAAKPSTAHAASQGDVADVAKLDLAAVKSELAEVESKLAEVESELAAASAAAAAKSDLAATAPKFFNFRLDRLLSRPPRRP